MMAVDFDAIRAEYPLESVVSATVKLEKAGGNKAGCCPFHPDRSPSFVVYKDEHFHCFGCGAHGDVIDFVANLQKVNTADAIRSLTGGSTPTFTAEDRAKRDAERKASEARQREREREATVAARERWARAMPINGAGAQYLIRKNVAPYGCRREGENLLVPIYGADGQIVSVQKIPPEAGSKKLFHGGAPVRGGRYIIGDNPGDIDQPIVVVEGFATGATVQAATGYAVAIAFSKANLAAVVADLATRNPGRIVIVGADSNGVAEAEAAAAKVGARVIVPEMLGAEGTDFNDQAAHYGLEDVAALFAAPAPLKLPLSVIFPADWTGIAPPVREWKVDGLVPNHQATLLTGAGAAGKSLLSQLLCTCVGLGLPLLGVQVAQCPTLYITCEDDADELHRRQNAICHGLSVSLEATRGTVHLLSLYGEIGNELCTFDDKRTLVISQRWHEIVRTARALNVRLVVLDNTSHMFTGNENARSEVAAFVNLCNSMAREIDGAVIMVGFPNKAGDSYSGSTAWENQVRSRLFLETPKNEDGVVLDPDFRVLRNEKANYARKGAEIGFMWSDGTFVLPNRDGGDPVSTNFTDDDLLIALREINKRWMVRNPFSAAPNSPERFIGAWLNYRFKLSRKAASNLVREWGAAGYIVSDEYDTHTKKTGLRVASWPVWASAEVRK